ncbi:MAG: hypothetical protein JWL80_70 [Parcubacteria group bacterium]|nr:hypothetical protein [Parcubacteria group bacterium]
MATPKKYENDAVNIQAVLANQKRLDWIMGGFIVVMFFLLVGLSFTLGQVMVDSYRSKEASYQEVVNKINDQGYKIDTMTTGMRKYNIIP